MYALFKNGKQHSKAHSTKEAATIEAYELGVVIDWGSDFPGDRPGRGLMDGYEIKPVYKEQKSMTTGPGGQE